jgi:DNA-binding NarL/FixJ family response regulator
MEERAPIRVLLADRPGFGQFALAQLVMDAPGVTLVAKVADAGMLEPFLHEWRPDVVIVDDRLLGDARWASLHPGVRVIVVGVDDDPGYAARAHRLGAEAWVRKDQADAVLPRLLTSLDPVSG